MKTLTVKLWGEEIGRLAWIPPENLIQFVFNPKMKVRPDFAPLLCPLGKWNPLIPFIAERDRFYQGFLLLLPTHYRIHGVIPYLKNG